MLLSPLCCSPSGRDGSSESLPSMILYPNHPCACRKTSDGVSVNCCISLLVVLVEYRDSQTSPEYMLDVCRCLECSNAPERVDIQIIRLYVTFSLSDGGPSTIRSDPMIHFRCTNSEHVD